MACKCNGNNNNYDDTIKNSLLFAQIFANETNKNLVVYQSIVDVGWTFEEHYKGEKEQILFTVYPETKSNS